MTELGLNKYEARVYLTLITEGASTAKNVSDTTGIPYGKVYEVVDTLSRKGFALVQPTKPMKVQAVPPAEALESAKKNFQRKFRELKGVIGRELDPLFTKTKHFADPKAVFWMMNGRATINRKIEYLIEKAQRRLCIFTSENGLRRLRIYRQAIKRAEERGAKVNICGVVNKENVDLVKALNFCSIRHASNAPSHFFSIDGRESLIVDAVPDDESILYGRDLGVWIINPTFTKFLENFFLSHFERSKELKQRLRDLRAE